jgi:hypothetical protein
MKCSMRTLSMTLIVTLLAASAGAVLSAQGTKPAAPKAPARPPTSGTTKPRTTTPPAAPTARKIVRTDVVNAEAVTEFEKSDRVAVVAAVGRYDDNGLAPLKFTIADAYEMSAELKRQGFIVHMLLNQEATNDEIKKRLESFANDKPGTLVFAFAGHGFQSKSGTNYLATYSATADTLEERGLSLTEVEALMKATGAKRNVLFIDACRNVPNTRAVTAPVSFRDFSQSEGVRMLLSTRPGGFSYEDPNLKHGIFTHFVIEGLRGKAANTDGKVTFEDLAGYVEKNVQSYAAENGGLSQKPFRSGEASGDFLLSTAAPAKEEELVQVKESAKYVTNDAITVTRQGDGALPASYVMMADDNELRLYSSPGMQLFAALQLDAETKDVPEGSKRYVGKSGRGDDVMHAVVRFEKGLPYELLGRVGKTCPATVKCSGQDAVKLPGEGQSVNSAIKKGAEIADKANKLNPFRRPTKAETIVNTTARGILALDGRSWEAFNLAPQLRVAAR